MRRFQRGIDLHTLANDLLQPTQAEKERARTAIDAMYKAAHKAVDYESQKDNDDALNGLSIAKVIKAGSASRNTWISLKFDIDIVLLFNNIEFDKFLTDSERIVKQLSKNLQEVFNRRPEVFKLNFTSSFHIACAVDGVDMDVLVGVCLSQDSPDEQRDKLTQQLFQHSVKNDVSDPEDRHALRQKLSGSYGGSVGPWFEQQLGDHRELVHAVVRLLKLFNSELDEDSQLRSAVYEYLCVNRFQAREKAREVEGCAKKQNLRDLFRDCLQLLAKLPDNNPVTLSWKEYPYEKAEVLDQPLNIIEPITGLNLIDKMNANVDWKHISDHAKEVLDMVSE